MKVLIIVSPYHDNLQIIAGCDDSNVVGLSERAFARFTKEAEARGALCRQCGLACEPDELRAGVCGPGIGCQADPHFHVFFKLPQGQQEEAIAAMAQSLAFKFVEMWRERERRSANGHTNN